MSKDAKEGRDFEESQGVESDKRAEARELADDLRSQNAKDGNELDWFEALYKKADGDAGFVPWADLEARPEFEQWLDALPEEKKQGRALDVGCGLGDNAALMVDAGFDVTAFDLSLTAVQWAAQRFKGKGIDWQQANLFELLPLWHDMFDLVHETYTIQSLRGEHREMGLRALVPLVKEGGTLFVLCRSTETGEDYTPPPWPLAVEELDILIQLGLTQVKFERLDCEKNGRIIPHFRVEYRK